LARKRGTDRAKTCAIGDLLPGLIKFKNAQNRLKRALIQLKAAGPKAAVPGLTPGQNPAI
jgi:hypothetical protein